jgi:hypothetical protein
MIEIDHICLAVRNVYEGSQRLRDETGLGHYEGGWFPKLGLANRIFPIGDDVYIEVESVIDVFALEEGNPAARLFRDATLQGDVFLGWCARTDSMDEIHAIARRLNAEVVSNSLRVRPDGSTKTSVRVPESTACWRKGLPNVFHIAERSQHPARLPAEHGTRRSNGVAWLELGGTAEQMREWLGPDVDRMPLRFNGRSHGLYAVGLNTDQGELVIRRPPYNEAA